MQAGIGGRMRERRAERIASALQALAQPPISRRTMGLPHFFIFASDAQRAGLAGLLLLLLALAAMWAERRRMKVARLDRVGWVPWTGVFLVLTVLGATMIVFAVQAMLGG